MFGGGIGTMFYNDLFILDTSAAEASPRVCARLTPCTETLNWTKAAVTGTVPGPRRAHTATLIGTRMYIIGGGEAGGKPTNDTFVLDIGTRSPACSLGPA